MRREIIKPKAHEQVGGLMIAAVMAGTVMSKKDTFVSIRGMDVGGGKMKGIKWPRGVSQ